MESTPLRKIRKKLGFCLEDVARATGMNQGNLSRIERAVCSTSTKSAARLSAFFNGEISEMEILYPERYSDSKRDPQGDVNHSRGGNNCG